MRIGDFHCPKHNKRMIRRMNMYRDNSFYLRCPIRNCKITATEHNLGHVMSFPAGQYTKDLRFEAHRIANSKFKTKDDFYNWLARNSRKKHIGYMFSRELKEVIEKLKKL